MVVENIILITVDCFRVDLFPISELKLKHKQVFTQAYSTGSYTPSSMPGLLASRYVKYSKKNIYLPKDAVLVYKQLQTHGFKVGIINTNEYISGFYGYDTDVDFYESFDSGAKITLMDRVIIQVRKQLLKAKPLYRLSSKLFLKSKLAMGGTLVPKVEAALMLRKARQFMQTPGKKFLWVHLMDLHGPLYDPNKQLSKVEAEKLFMKTNREPETLTQAEKDQTLKLYKANVAYVVHQLNQFLESLESESVIVITTDHGDELFESGKYGHKAVFDDWIIHVPLVMQVPGKPSATYDNIVSSIDIPPTVLKLVGVPVPDNYEGENLFSKTRDFAIVKNIVRAKLDEAVISRDEAYEINKCVVTKQGKHVTRQAPLRL